MSGRVLVVLLSTIILFHCTSASPPGNGRIVGGSTAVSNQVPYIASLRWIRDNNLHFCGGSIIRPAWILTAAHCVTGVLDDEITVVVGSTRLSSGGYAHRSSRIISHPDYDEDSLCADVAVVQVSQSFVYNDAVQPILLSNVEITEAHALVSGWGMLNHTYDHLPLPDELQILNTWIIPNEECRDGHPVYGDYIFESKICTLTQAGQGTCMGDSGGPLVVGNYVVGITSWVIPCALGYPDVFTRVSFFADWILSTVDG